MADAWVQLPDDSANTGKKVRTQSRTVAGSSVHEHYNILQDVSGDVQARILSGDPNFGDPGLVVRNIPSGTQNVLNQSVVGVQIVGGGINRVSISGDTLPVTISQSVNVQEQNKIGAHVASGLVGITGDRSITDGADPTIESTVRDYANSNPITVVLTNASGDTYSPTPKEPICQTIPFNITSTGTTTIAGPYTGRVIKVCSYDLQGISNVGSAQGHFGSAASGSALTHDWVFAVREGTTKYVSPVGGGYIFKTNLNEPLVFECSAVAFRGSVTFQTGDSF